MKSMRYIKHRTYSRDAAEMMQGLHHNPLKTKIHVRPSHSLTTRLLLGFRNTTVSKWATGEPFVIYYNPLAIDFNTYN